MSDASKVRPTHTQRAAVIYVRQSSPTQVLNNRESTERQYALVQRAIDLGWRREQVTILDEDLGVSADGIAKRAGFAQLTADVALLKVGLVVGVPALPLQALGLESVHHAPPFCSSKNKSPERTCRKMRWTRTDAPHAGHSENQPSPSIICRLSSELQHPQGK
jgi:hypothetical protein